MQHCTFHDNRVANHDRHRRRSSHVFPLLIVVIGTTKREEELRTFLEVPQTGILFYILGLLAPGFPRRPLPVVRKKGHRSGQMVPLLYCLMRPYRTKAKNPCGLANLRVPLSGSEREFRLLLGGEEKVCFSYQGAIIVCSIWCSLH